MTDIVLRFYHFVQTPGFAVGFWLIFLPAMWLLSDYLPDTDKDFQHKPFWRS